MGVILTTAIVFAIIAAIVELRIATKVSVIKKAVQKIPILGVVFSIALSFLLGTMFGAAGLIVMFAAIGATVLTQPVYTVMNKTKDASKKTQDNIQEFKDTWRPVFKLIKYAFLLLTAPLWVPVKIRRWYLDNVKSPTPSGQASDYTFAS